MQHPFEGCGLTARPHLEGDRNEKSYSVHINKGRPVKAISIIHAEHRNLGAVLLCFEALVHGIEQKDKEPDFHLFDAILTYSDSFLDRFHHPKEDEYLFPAVCRRYPQSRKLVQELKEEHAKGIKLMNELRNALSIYKSGGKPAFGRFRDAAHNYISFERQHVYKEERELLPLACEHLTSEDWESIDATFCANEDPLFGEKPRKQYAQLSKLILNIFLFGDPLL